MSRHIYTLSKPASWHKEFWRDGLPLGNGLTAMTVPGFIGTERILFNRHDLWEGGKDPEIPDITDVFQEMRADIDRGDYSAANRNNFQAALSERGYRGSLDAAEPLGWLTIDFDPEHLFKHYRRGVNMQTGEAFVEFELDGCKFRRTAFISRACDVAVLRMTGERPFTMLYGFELYREAEVSTATENGLLRVAKDGRAGVNIAFQGDFTSTVHGDRLGVTGTDYTVFVRCFSLGSDRSLDAVLGRSYAELFREHVALHQPLYDSLSIELADDSEFDATNEELLEQAYEDVAPLALLERTWRFGRYIFISAAAANGLPVPLYGRWHGAGWLPWCQFVANENVEVTYWHALAGGLEYALPPLIRYYTGHMDRFRECAQKVFGMRGIWVNGYTTPNSFGMGQTASVITNWISCAGWLSHHFWDYYIYSRDEKMLREEILPFMYEAALFYCDYVTYQDGQMRIYPSVSPENAPGVMIDGVRYGTGTVVENATMDFAIMKELLTNLLEGIRVTGLYADEAAEFKAVLERIPPYQINEDGAVKEWMKPNLADSYYHRHLSHIYPVFPGLEVTAHNQPELFKAFRKAVMLRKLGAQSGWSLAHMASIYARMGEGEKALECLDVAEKSVVMDSLFTDHNDWRNMGTTMYWSGESVMQLDAAYGMVNAMQEMLFCWQKEALSILPAKPERMSCGCARGFTFPEGTLDIEWTENGKVTVNIRASRDIDTDILLRGQAACHLKLAAGENRTLEL